MSNRHLTFNRAKNKFLIFPSHLYIRPLANFQFQSTTNVLSSQLGQKFQSWSWTLLFLTCPSQWLANPVSCAFKNLINSYYLYCYHRYLKIYLLSGILKESLEWFLRISPTSLRLILRTGFNRTDVSVKQIISVLCSKHSNGFSTQLQ